MILDIGLTFLDHVLYCMYPNICGYGRNPRILLLVKNSDEIFGQTFVPKLPYPLSLTNFFRDILLANNILGILTKEIVKKNFSSILQVKNGGRGVESTPPPPPVGLRKL